MPSKDHIVATIQEYCRAESALDREAFMALFAENVVHEDPVGYATRTGLAGIAELWAMIEASRPDLRLEHEVIVCGNEAIGIMSARTGPQDARREIKPIVDHFTFDEAGKIAGVRAFYSF